MNRDNVRNRVLRTALKRAGLNVAVRTHDLRHTFASALISGGGDPVFVAGQLGHADASVTLGIYSHAFDQHRHRDAMTSFLENGWGHALSDGNDLKTDAHGQGRSDAVIPLPDSAPARAVAE